MCEHEWTELEYPGRETRCCVKCDTTEAEVELDAAIERAEKAETERDGARKERDRAEAALAVRDRDARCAELEANYAQAQEELGKLDAHVIVLEARVAKLREALRRTLDNCKFWSDDFKDEVRAVLKDTE